MARKAGDVRQIITLQCGDCRERNYTSAKNRRNDPQRMELKNIVRGAATTPTTGKLGSRHGKGLSTELTDHLYRARWQSESGYLPPGDLRRAQKIGLAEP